MVSMMHAGVAIENTNGPEDKYLTINDAVPENKLLKCPDKMLEQTKKC